MTENMPLIDNKIIEAYEIIERGTTKNKSILTHSFKILINHYWPSPNNLNIWDENTSGILHVYAIQLINRKNLNYSTTIKQANGIDVT